MISCFRTARARRELLSRSAVTSWILKKSGNLLKMVKYIAVYELNIGLHVRVNTTLHCAKTDMHARFDNTQCKPNFSGTTCNPWYRNALPQFAKTGLNNWCTEYVAINLVNVSMWIQTCNGAVYYIGVLYLHNDIFLKSRLHDTTGCQTGCTTGLTTGCIHDTAVCQTGCQTRGAVVLTQYRRMTDGQTDRQTELL